MQYESLYHFIWCGTCYDTLVVISWLYHINTNKVKPAWGTYAGWLRYIIPARYPNNSRVIGQFLNRGIKVIN